MRPTSFVLASSLVLVAACGDTAAESPSDPLQASTGDTDARSDGDGDNDNNNDTNDGELTDGDARADADVMPDPPSCAWCTAYELVSPLGQVQDDALPEISGVAMSRQHVDVLYVHNDSGNAAEVFVLATGGETLAVVHLDGATNRDWEDMALGPCPDGTCLYVGDIGDAHADGIFVIYRFLEPEVSAGSALGELHVTPEALRFRYPDGGSHNAETLLVHPLSGDVYVVTKTAFRKKSAAYKLPTPHATEGISTLLKVADLEVPEGVSLPVTGGAIHPCGDGLLLRTYDKLYSFATAEGAAFESVFTAPFTSVPVATEAQGEAVGFRPDGLGYVTVSEGLRPKIQATTCR